MILSTGVKTGSVLKYRDRNIIEPRLVGQCRNAKGLKNVQSHLEYCRTPQYREWKKDYDEEYRYKNEYGEYWESIVIIIKIDKEVRRLVPDKYERMKMRGLLQRIRVRQQLRRMGLV